MFRCKNPTVEKPENSEELFVSQRRKEGGPGDNMDMVTAQEFV